MNHVIDLKAEFAKLGINDPSAQLLDTAKAEVERQFALVSAFSLVHGATEKRRAYNRKSNPQPENIHA
jgi:hypothetical protein